MQLIILLKNILYGLVISILTVILIIILFEISLRLFRQEIHLQKKHVFQSGLLKQKVASPQAYEFIPNQKNRDKNGILFTINNYGIRGDNEISDENILLVGDSMIFGVNVEYDDTISRKLQKKLNNNGYNYKVINTSVPGYNIIQEAELIKKLLPIYKPKILIWSLYYNDFYSEKFIYNNKNNITVYKVQNMPIPNVLNLKSKNHISLLNLHIYSWLCKRINTINYLLKINVPSNYFYNSYNAKLVEETKKAINQIVEKAKLENIKILFTSINFDNDYPEQVFHQNIFDEITNSYNLPYSKIIFKNLNYKREEVVSDIYNHPNELGNDIAANELALKLIDLNYLYSYDKK